MLTRLSRMFIYDSCDVELLTRFQRFISTMETETISSRNIVDLLFREEFNSGICGPNPILPEDSDLDSEYVLESKEAVNKSFVLGWDC